MGTGVLDTEMPLASVKSGYLIEGYILTIRDVDLKIELIRDAIKYKSKFQRVFLTDTFSSSVDKRKRFCYSLVVQRIAVA